METKVCGHCKVPKNINNFSWKIKAKGLRHCICKKCYKIERKRYYQDERYQIYYKNKAKRRSSRIRKENRIRVFEYLLKHPCVDCGESDPVVLEFDHVRGTKENTISCLLNGSGWKYVEKEISKCDVRCANCHRRKTAKDRKFFKYTSSSPNGYGT